MQDYFSYLFQAITDLLNQNASFLEGMGMNIFRALAIIMVSWFGVQSALSSAGGGGGANWPKFSALLQELVICYAMLAFYTVPIPGFGVSFTHLILDEVQSLTATLNLTSVQHIVDSLNGLETNIPLPNRLRDPRDWQISDSAHCNHRGTGRYSRGSDVRIRRGRGDHARGTDFYPLQDRPADGGGCFGTGYARSFSTRFTN